MSKLKEYTINNIKELNWNESIRLRPGMYVGDINVKGFTETLKGFISSVILCTNSDCFSIELKDDLSAKIILNNPNKKIENNWGNFQNINTKEDNTWVSSRGIVKNFLLLELYVLNALSEKFKICFLNSENKKLREQYFEKGKPLFSEGIEEINCSVIEIDFTLDKDIWGTDFFWNKIYITHRLREFAYLYKRTKFEIKYKEENEDCRIIHHFKNGLKDRIDIEILNGLCKSYFVSEIDEKIGNFHVEAAFAFRECYADAPFLKSYVNDHFTFENGTHVKGLLKGFIDGIKKYLHKNEQKKEYKITEKNITESLVAIINIEMEAAVFSGSIKNKLENREIIEPIKNYVAELFFEKLNKNEEITMDFINRFEK